MKLLTAAFCLFGATVAASSNETSEELYEDMIIELGRFYGDDVQARFDRETGALIVEAPFDPFGTNKDKSEKDKKYPEVKKLTFKDVAGNLRKRSADMDTDLSGSVGSVPVNLTAAMPRNEVRYIIGQDDRLVYHKTTDYPARIVGKLMPMGCTGTMIGRNLVLTAAHCFQGFDRGQITFTPGYDDGEAPFGVATVRCVLHWDVVDDDGTSEGVEPGFDYAVFVLRQNIGDLTGWAGYSRQELWASNTPQNLFHFGYPGEHLLGETDIVIQGNPRFETRGLKGRSYHHQADIVRGHSGGPIWRWYPGDDGEREEFPRVVAVQSHETETRRWGSGLEIIERWNVASGGDAMFDLIQYARDKY